MDNLHIIKLSAPVPKSELLVVLTPAAESIGRLTTALSNTHNSIYAAIKDNDPSSVIIAAAVVKWEEAEIMYIAVDESYRGKGVGRQMIEYIKLEGAKAGIEAIFVGTGNSSIENIVFYQKCGFRMYQVRRGYFDNLGEPEWENGIRLRDMIVFRCDTQKKE